MRAVQFGIIGPVVLDDYTETELEGLRRAVTRRDRGSGTKIRYLILSVRQPSPSCHQKQLLLCAQATEKISVTMWMRQLGLTSEERMQTKTRLIVKADASSLAGVLKCFRERTGKTGEFTKEEEYGTPAVKGRGKRKHSDIETTTTACLGWSNDDDEEEEEDMGDSRSSISNSSGGDGDKDKAILQMQQQQTQTKTTKTPKKTGLTAAAAGGREGFNSSLLRPWELAENRESMCRMADKLAGHALRRLISGETTTDHLLATYRMQIEPKKNNQLVPLTTTMTKQQNI